MWTTAVATGEPSTTVAITSRRCMRSALRGRGLLDYLLSCCGSDSCSAACSIASRSDQRPSEHRRGPIGAMAFPCSPSRRAAIGSPRRATRAASDRRDCVVALEQQIELLREHRQALITAAVTGQLDVAEGGCMKPRRDRVRGRRSRRGCSTSGYAKRRPAERFDRALGLDPGELLAFVAATQPDAWARLTQLHGGEDAARDRVPQAARGRARRARHGRRAAPRRQGPRRRRPARVLQARARARRRSSSPRYDANRLTVVRQLRYERLDERRSTWRCS